MRQNLLVGTLIVATVAWASFTAVNEVRENRRQAIITSLLNSTREHKQNPAAVVASLKEAVPALKKNQPLLLTFGKSRAEVKPPSPAQADAVVAMCAGVAEMFLEAAIAGDISTATRAADDLDRFCSDDWEE